MDSTQTGCTKRSPPARGTHTYMPPRVRHGEQHVYLASQLGRPNLTLIMRKQSHSEKNSTRKWFKWPVCWNIRGTDTELVQINKPPTQDPTRDGTLYRGEGDAARDVNPEPSDTSGKRAVKEVSTTSGLEFLPRGQLH